MKSGSVTSLRRIVLWKGYHSAELFAEVRAVWSDSDETLLVLCPPLAVDPGFIPLLPAGEVECRGEAWSPEERASVEALSARPRNAADSGGTAYPDRPLFGVFTSGTVGGKPRLILYSRKNVEASLEAILGVFERERIEAIFAYPQPFHTFGLVLAYVQAAFTGRPLIAPAGRYASSFHTEWKEAARRYRGLLTLGTPTHFRDLLQVSQNEDSREIPPTYSCIVGGAAASRELWLALRDRMKIEAPSIGYGCTEASPGLTHLPPGIEPVEDGEVGFVLPGTKLEILPEVGIEFQGPQACLAILHEGKIGFPEKIRIRDRLTARPDGRLTFHGRYDLVFNRGGMKFSLEEIEKTLRESDPASDFLCVAVPHERLGEDLGILVRSTAPLTKESREKTVHFLQKKFLAHFDPEKVIAVDVLPTNAAAKPDRGAGTRLLSERTSS